MSLDDTIAEDRREAALDALVALGRDTEPSFHPQGEGRYRMLIPSPGVVLELDYLRRERGHLHGELLVRADLAAARTVEGVLSVSDLNLSSSISRKKHGEYLAERAPGSGVDWTGLLEDFAQRVLVAERSGDSGVWLHELPEPSKEAEFSVLGLRLLRQHPTCIFGDGGGGKSFLGLFVLGELRRQGVPVGFADWELDGNEHRRRLRMLFGPQLPEIRYIRCSRPFVYEVERIRRIVHADGLKYLMLDSISYACHVAAETQEAVGAYAQALRSLGELGTLHLAHVTKDSSSLKPYGSVMWHNLMRSTWFMRKSASIGPYLTVHMRQRKYSLTAQHLPLGFRFTFGPERVEVRREDPMPGEGEE